MSVHPRDIDDGSRWSASLLLARAAAARARESPIGQTIDDFFVPRMRGSTTGHARRLRGR